MLPADRLSANTINETTGVYTEGAGFKTEQLANTINETTGVYTAAASNAVLSKQKRRKQNDARTEHSNS